MNQVLEKYSTMAYAYCNHFRKWLFESNNWLIQLKGDRKTIYWSGHPVCYSLLSPKAHFWNHKFVSQWSFIFPNLLEGHCTTQFFTHFIRKFQPGGAGIWGKITLAIRTLQDSNISRYITIWGFLFPIR